MTAKQEKNRQAAIDYINKHTNTEYKEECDYLSLDHHWLEKHENVEKYYALRAIDIALGLE